MLMDGIDAGPAWGREQTMTTTYYIHRIPAGARVECEGLDSLLTARGWSGHLIAGSDVDAIRATAERVLATGNPETVVCGMPSPAPSQEDRESLARHERLMADMDRPDSDL